MRTLFVLFAAAAMFFAGGCSNEYDDSALSGRVDDLENRVAKLEELCRQMNTNISSLQTIVTALQANDYITSCTPLTENGIQIGYTLTFAKSGSIVIYHGQNGKDGANGADGKDGKDGADGKDGKDGADGKDGHTPVIGAKTDTDGVIYWTLDGEWLLDENGQKIPVQGRDGQDGADGEDGKDGVDGQPGADGEDGKDGVDGQPGANGKDGITPQLKIEEGYWYISYDNGTSWTQLGKATGENGADGKDGQDGADGESFFQNVTEDQDYVYLILSTGEQVAIPKHHQLAIAFDKTDEICVKANQTYSIGYTLTGADEQTVVKALAQDGFRAVVKKTDNASGTIEITTPATILSSEVLVFVSDGKERTIMRSINFVEEVILITTKSYTVGDEGGTVKVDLSTNLDYTVVIPEADLAWISVEKIESRAVRNETITLNVATNSTPAARYSEVRLVDAFGVTAETLLITQEAGPDNTGIVHFADEIFKEFMVENFDKNKDGEISEYEASLITEINCPSKLIQSLEGIEYCTALAKLYCSGNLLTALDVSKNTKLIWLLCAYNKLTTLDVSKNTALTILYCSGNQLTALDVSNNTSLTDLQCDNNQLTALDLSKNTALTTLWCYGNQLTALDVSNTVLTRLRCSSNPLEVLKLGETDPAVHDGYFDEDKLGIDNGVTSLKVIGSKLTQLRVARLQSLDVSECPALKGLYCSFNSLTTLDVSNNTALTKLNCNHNQLTALDVSNNTKLEELDCSENQLTTLDISSNTRLGTLTCSYNQLTSLDVSNNTRLTGLNCYKNQLTTLDLSKNTALTDLRCSCNPLEVVNLGEASLSLDIEGLNDLGSSGKLKVIGTKFTTLDVSGNKLQYLDVSECPALTELSCYRNNLTALDLSKNTDLTKLNCNDNQLTALDVSNNTKLEELDCGSNSLTTLDISSNTRLGSLTCSNNQLTALDLSKNTALTTLGCSYNQLTALDVSNNTELIRLYCSGNKLTVLDVSNNTAITELHCDSNQLTTLDVSKTNLGNSTEWFPLDCSSMETLQNLYLKTGWEIRYINVDRHPSYIPEQTIILYKD